MLVDWERVLLLLSLEWLIKGSNAIHITMVIINAVVQDGGLAVQDIWERLVCFGSDGASILQGKQNGVVVQIQGMHAPHCQGMHYVAHRTNLVVEVLSELSMISTIEKLHSYIRKSPKQHLELE